MDKKEVYAMFVFYLITVSVINGIRCVLEDIRPKIYHLLLDVDTIIYKTFITSHIKHYHRVQLGSVLLLSTNTILSGFFFSSNVDSFGTKPMIL